MAGLINTGIWGFISSAKATGKKILNAAGEEVDEWVSTFVSGVSGWLIDKLGNAEFKSVFVRDKFITNEFVYNRIKVTEDEEIISSSMKIASYIDNEDGTFTVYPDLREGDYNPLAEDDLLVGYYHNPGNSGVIYAVQKFKALSDPSKDDQSILLEPEGDSIPYQHMIIVRIGNITDEERQSFIRISSRTNCQYFFDGIDSWSAYDDPEHVKCTLGHADIGLIPGWAKTAVEGVKRWFGLIADGVIIRGTFVLHNDKTIEDELNSREAQIRGDFQIREDGITGKWQEVITYAEQAAGSATAAGEHEKKVIELAGEFSANAKKLSAEFSEKVTTETSDALGAITTAKDEATGSLQLTARDFTLAFSKQVETEMEEATGAINIAKETAKSELQLTAKNLTTTFEEKVKQETTSVTGEITEVINSAKSEINQTAKEINAKVTEAKTYSDNSANSAAESEAAKVISVEKAAEAKQTADGFQTTVTEVTKKAVDDAVSGAGSIIEEKVTTQVTQNAKQWKVEVMGADENGNPNKILAAINASKEGIKIDGNRVEITGTLIADIIKAYGLNINDNFIVHADGTADVKGDFISNNEQDQIVISSKDKSILLRENNLSPLPSVKISFDDEVEKGFRSGVVRVYRNPINGAKYAWATLNGEGLDIYMAGTTAFFRATRMKCNLFPLLPTMEAGEFYVDDNGFVKMVK